MPVLSKNKLYTFLVGLSVGVAGLSVTLLILFLTGGLEKLIAAGVGTGAADVNARYLDGFGTQQGGAAAANKVYVSDASGFLPSGTVNSAAIVDDTIASADIADGTIASADIADGTIASADIADGTITSAKIADDAIKIECKAASCIGNGCTATASCTSGYRIINVAASSFNNTTNCNSDSASGGLSGCIGNTSCSITDSSTADKASVAIVCIDN